MSVTFPAPEILETVTAAPCTATDAASTAVIVKVAGAAPLSASVFVDDVNVTVEPLIVTGNGFETVPEVAVMVAVRLTFDVTPTPALNFTVAVPSAPVVTKGKVSVPVSALKSTLSPGTILFAVSMARIVIVVSETPDVVTVDGDAEMIRSLTTWPLVVVLVVVVGAGSAGDGHPESITVAATSDSHDNSLFGLKRLFPTTLLPISLAG